MKRLIFIIFALSILGLPVISLADPYSHIKLGLYRLYAIPEEDQELVGKRYSIIVRSYPCQYPTVDGCDFSTIYANNPDMIMLTYVGSQPYKYPHVAPWTGIWSWMRSEGYAANKEENWLHTGTNKTWTTEYPKATTLFYAGGTQGTIEGTVTAEAKSRIPHHTWGGPVYDSSTMAMMEYVNLSRVGGTVTATRYGHGYQVGYRLNVYASGNSTFNGDNFEILTRDANTFTYADGRADGSYPTAITKTTSATIGSIVRSSGVTTVTLSTTNDENDFEQGDLVLISNCSKSSFNGSFLITTQSANTFTYSQAGESNDSASDGVATYFGWTMYAANPTAQYRFTYTKDHLAANLMDAAGNKFNGIYYDNIAGVPLNPGSYTSAIEFQAEIGTYPTFKEWWSHYMVENLQYLRDTDPNSVATFVLPKTAYNAANGDSYRYVGRTFTESPITGMYEFYTQDAIDIILLEDGFTTYGIPYEDINYDIVWLKRVYDLMDTYGKKMIYESRTSWGNKAKSTWTQYDPVSKPYIWYTDDYSRGSKMRPTLFYAYDAGTYRTATTRVDSIDALNGAGKFFYDQSNGRLYVWLTGNFNPNNGTSNEQIRRYEPYAMFSLNAFYVFGNHANGYFFPYETGTMAGGAFIYNLSLSNPDFYWWDAIGYNIGTPTTGGVTLPLGTLGTDLWGVSLETSSKAYVMYQDQTVARDRLYARKYTGGYSIVRFKRYNYDVCGSDAREFTMPFKFQQLRADGTLGSTTDKITIGRGEGVFLVTETKKPSLKFGTGGSIKLGTGGTVKSGEM